ncbi:uncharacterized protein YbjT (DUF2867 family) [Desulfobaculum xiamenense]|uniref:Uncharacterized protein YbjT (DUF2867 family) n=1 Tax=Desulfobaculum xiamenense TaxID=995050 RepID=A0A846QNJ8_9BACT|nr:SDR family oxidoreductase [Desulfobaculum xiamenense]NJB68032.1 uncharacterized protein YbjT (DUF2867 family) [Desulfobaculum xiamenense]
MPSATHHSSPSPSARRVAVIGASGYVGGRLVPLLLDAGHTVRAVVRSPRKLSCRPWSTHPRLETAAADVRDLESLTAALADVEVAYYLVHSMRPGQRNFARADHEAARVMAEAAARCGVSRIIYLGGLGDEDDPTLSRHLRSRMETGRVLAEGPVPVTCLRAAMILGSGSASFEIMRYLVDRLPVMVTPRWVRTKCQPIAISDVLGYLVGCLDVPQTAGRTFDIGGPDILNYEEIFALYAEEAGLRRRTVVPVPVFTPALSSWWIHLVTPVPASLARPLAEGLRNEVVCRENDIRALVPRELLSVREAIRRALDRVRQGNVETCWADAGETRPPEWLACGDAPYAGGTVFECNHRVALGCAPAEVWRTVRGIGGAHGWYHADVLWWLRGLADRLIGGVGLRRGRRDPDDLHPGDALDFWRVLVVEPERRLQLLAEMKLPGEAILQFSLTPLPDGGTELSQIARFLPRGLWGMAYWYALAPVHGWLFKGMLRGMARATACPLRGDVTAFEHSGDMCILPSEPTPPQRGTES